VGAHQGARGLLVGGVFFGQPIPQRSGAQHVEVAPAQAGARLDRPGLVEVVWQEVASIQIRRRAANSLVGATQPSLRSCLEPLDVRLHSGIGPRHEHAAVIDDRPLVTDREPGEVQGLSKVGAGGLGLALGPERLHDLSPMHPMAGGEREQLHDVGGAAAAPCVARDRDTVDRDGEPAEEPERQRSHAGNRTGRPRPRPPRPRERWRNGRLLSVDDERRWGRMALYMDVHDILPDGMTAVDVAGAHAADLRVQERFGVRYLSYWVDEQGGKVFCLIDAPNADAAHAVHREAHGLVADEIYPVVQG
jgi:hypothetical protein